MQGSEEHKVLHLNVCYFSSLYLPQAKLYEANISLTVDLSPTLSKQNSSGVYLLVSSTFPPPTNFLCFIHKKF